MLTAVEKHPKTRLKSRLFAVNTKVLLLTDSFLPHAGGSREYYHNIYRELVALGGSEVKVLTKKVPGWREFDGKAISTSYRISRRFKPLLSLKYSQLPKGILSFLSAIYSIVTDKPSVIHAGDLYPPGVIAMVLKRLLGIPYVVYCHGEEIPQLDAYRFQPLIRNRIYRNANRVIAASEFTKQNLLRIGIPEKRIVKITPGVDASRFRHSVTPEELKKRYGLESKSVILTVARLIPRKGHRVALTTMAKLASQFPDVHYIIAGQGPEENALKRLSEELGLKDRVTFSGLVSEQALADFFTMCDILVMPNRQESNGEIEGFGIVFLEGNAAGKPVVGGRSGGATEAIAEGETGFLINPDDAAQLEDVLRRLLCDSKLREELGAAGLRRVRTDFTWRQRAERLRQVNTDVIEEALTRDSVEESLERLPVKKRAET